MFTEDIFGGLPGFGLEGGSIRLVGVTAFVLTFGGELTVFDPVVGLGDVGDGGSDGAGDLVVTMECSGFVDEVKTLGGGVVFGGGEVDVDVEMGRSIGVSLLTDSEVDGREALSEVFEEEFFRGIAMRICQKELDTFQAEAVVTRLTRHCEEGVHTVAF